MTKARFATSVSMDSEDMVRQQEIAKMGISIIDTLRQGQMVILKTKEAIHVRDGKENQPQRSDETLEGKE